MVVEHKLHGVRRETDIGPAIKQFLASFLGFMIYDLVYG